MAIISKVDRGGILTSDWLHHGGGILIFRVIFLSVLGFQSYGASPDTVLASQQPLITVKSLEYESAQFKALGRYNSSIHKLKTNATKRDQLMKEFDRVKSLAAAGQASSQQVQIAELNFQKAETNLIRAQDEVQKFKTEVQLNKIKILTEGNPSVDHRRAMADALLESLQLEKQNLESSLQSYKSNLTYYENYVKNGKYLLDRKVISQVEYERRLLELEAAQDQVQSTVDEISGVSEAISGVELSRKKL